MRKIKKIIVIIQRSNGDVFLSSSLIKGLYEHFDDPHIDLLVNDDTFNIARLIPFVKNIHTFSYLDRQFNRWGQEKNIVLQIFNKYDLSINLTASDRSVFYALLAGKKSISAIEIDRKKSWWKKMFLTHHYFFDNTQHILINNLKSLSFLKINFENIHYPISPSQNSIINIKKKLKAKAVENFLIFHPSAQYEYKIYPQHLRNTLLSSLSKLGVPILVTGSNNQLDLNIKKQIPSLVNVIDFIGETSIEEFIALSELSLGYIGMDTLNMHIAASQNKRIFAVFGSTNLAMWSPWSNELKTSTSTNKPIQTYGKNTIFQSASPCEVCGIVGCGSNHDIDEFTYIISPVEIFNEVSEWYESSRI